MMNLLSAKTRRRVYRFTYHNIMLPIAICFAWLVILAIAGCSLLPEAKDQHETTHLRFDVTAGPHANPDQQGRASPIMVTVYELKTPQRFQEMDFMSLQNNGKEVLKEDLLHQEEYILQPDETIKIHHKTTPGTTAIGITAGYRNITHAVWKKVFNLAPTPYAAWYRFFIPANRNEKIIRLDTNELRVIPVRHIAPQKRKETIKNR